MIRRNAYRVIFGFVCVVFGVAAHADAPKRVENRQFGFSAGVPPGTVTCVARDRVAETATGFTS